MLLVKKCQFLLYLVLVKTRLEIRFNNVLDRIKAFFEYKNKTFQCPKNCIFPRGLTHASGEKCNFFDIFYFVFTQNKTRNRV